MDTQCTSKTNPVGWFEIYVQDIERAKAFYEAVFDTKLQKLESEGIEMWTFPMDQNAAGCAGALAKIPGKDAGTGGTIVYFKCDDCAVEAGRVGQHGGRVVKEKMSIGEYGHIAIIVDPEENMIGLHSQK